MRLTIFVLIILVIGCRNSDRDGGLLNDLVDKPAVAIFLNTYQLDQVPREIGRLTRATRLYIATDSLTGWTVYPPLIVTDQPMTPPFKHLPEEITTLTKLEQLSLVDLNLVTLPDNFGNLQNLDSLGLFMNKLTIANEMEKLKKLKKLKYIGLFGNKVDSTDVEELKREIPGIFVDW